MKQLTYILSLLVLGSCMTPKKAIKVLNKHGFVAAKYCADTFPVDTSFKKGEPVINTDTLFLKPDSVICKPTDTPYYTPCPPNKAVIQRIYRTDTLIKLNTALVGALKGRIDSLKEEINAAKVQMGVIEGDKVRLKQGRNAWREKALITWGAILLVVSGYFFGGGIISKIKSLW